MEVRTQWDMLTSQYKLKSILHSDTYIKVVTAHNKHESFYRAQEGGSSLMEFDNLANIVKSSRVDASGLGRLCWFNTR